MRDPRKLVVGDGRARAQQLDEPLAADGELLEGPQQPLQIGDPPGTGSGQRLACRDQLGLTGKFLRQQFLNQRGRVQPALLLAR